MAIDNKYFIPHLGLCIIATVLGSSLRDQTQEGLYSEIVWSLIIPYKMDYFYLISIPVLGLIQKNKTNNKKPNLFHVRKTLNVI